MLKFYSIILLSLASFVYSEQAYQRRDILIDDFEKGYEKWTINGDAFGKKPATVATSPEGQDIKNFQGKSFVNTFSQGRDRAKGTMLSQKFTAERDFITLWIFGGDFKSESCVNLLIDGKIVASKYGEKSNVFMKRLFDLRKYQGQKFQLEIVDRNTKAWGVIGVDHIVMTDDPDGLLALDKSVSLFDGESLKGWDLVNKKQGDLWLVKDGILQVKGSKEQSVLRTEKNYENFEFSCLFKQKGNISNLGVLYRAYGRDYVLGYQAGLSLDRLGNIIDLNRRDLLKKAELKTLQKVYRYDLWNSLTIRVKGRKQQVYINGILVSEYLEYSEVRSKGFIALQFLGEEGSEAQFQDMGLKQL